MIGLKINRWLSAFLGAAVLGTVIFLAPKLILGLLFLIALGLFFYHWSEIAFCFLIVYLPFQIALNLAPDVDLLSGRILILLFFFVQLINFLIKKERIDFKKQIGDGSPRRILWHSAGLILFFLVALFSLLGAAEPLWGWRKLFVFVSIFPLFFLTAYFSKDRAKTEKLVWALIAGAAISAIIALVQFSAQFIFGLDKVMDFWAIKVAPVFYGQTFAGLVAQNPSWLVSAGGRTLMRAVGLFPDPHMLSFSLGLVLPFVLALIFFGKKYRRLLSVIFCLLFAVIFLTFSRGGYLGLVASLIFVVLLAWHKLNRNGKFFLGGLAGLVLVIILFFGSSVASRFVSSFDLAEGSNFDRLRIWQESLEVAKEHFLAGAGLGNYPAEVDFNAGYRSAVTSHNLYLDILAEMGIFGLLAWFWFSGGAWLSALENIRRSVEPGLFLGAFGALTYFMVHSFFETAIFNPTILALLMVVAGLVAGSSCRKRHENREMLKCL